MATGSPELRLGVTFDIDAFKRTALPSLAQAASDFQIPIALEFDRASIAEEMRLLGRQLGQRKYRIDLDDTSIKSAIENANKLAVILSRTKGTLARSQALGSVVTTAPGAGGPTAPQVKSIYGAAKELGIVKGLVNRTRDELVAELKVGFASAGGDAVEGLIRGLLAGEGKLAGIAASLGDAAVKSLKESLEIRSPSRRFFRIGQQSGQGFNDGLIASIDATMGEVGTLMNTSLRRLDRMVEMRQRKARAIAPLQPNYELAQRQAGAISGQREKVQVVGEALQLGASAGAFQTGSYQQLTKLLQSAQIQANLITPNTAEWNQLQKRIAGLNFELQQAAKLADEIQMRNNLAAFSPKSLSSMESRLVILKARAKDIDPDLSQWKELNKEIQKVERGIEKASRKPLTGGQRMGAAGGAFLYGGGLGGGFGSALGGIAGGLTGGVPGAFTGAAVGQAADDIAKSVSAMTEQAATIAKLQKGLAIASNGLRDYASASAEVERISNRLLLPIEEVYRKFTQLKASTVALGIDSKTTGQIFEGLAASVLQSGGSLEDVDGAMRAVVQVFSKGKVNAEELRGQIGDRLPGAVVEFAQSAGLSMEQLEKAFEAGGVTLEKFVNFLKQKNKDTKKFVDGMATNSEYAGARMEKAFEKVKLTIGAAFQPTGAAFQNFIVSAINSVDFLIKKLIEMKLLMPGSDFYAAQAMAGGGAGIKDLEKQLLETGAIEANLRNAMGIFSNFSPALAEATKKVRILEKALKQIRDLEKLTKQRPNQPKTEEQAANAQKILDAIEKREEAIAGARQKREEEIADIRKQAVERAKQIEEDFARQRISREREIAQAKRGLAQSEQNAVFNFEATRVGLAGGDPELIRIQEQVSKAANQRAEEKITLEEKLLDEQSDRARKVEDLKKETANAINESNARYAKAIGETQQSYARSVAKIIDKGSESASKRLVMAAQIVALYSQRAMLNEQIAGASGAVIPQPQDGKYPFPKQGEFTGEELSAATAFKDVQLPLANILEVDKKIEKLSTSLSANMGTVAASVKPVTVNISDLTDKVNKSVQSLSQLDKSFESVALSKGEQDFIAEILSKADQSTQPFAELRKGLAAQLEEINAVSSLMQGGIGEEQAKQDYKILVNYKKILKEISVLYEKAISTSANPDTRNTLTSFYQQTKNNLIKARDAALSFSSAISNDSYVKSLQDEVKLLSIVSDKERRVAEIKLQKGSAKAQEIFNLETLKKNIEETRALIDGFVSGATSDYKGFLKAVISGEDAADALKQFQDGLKDKVLTIFLDFAMAPVEKFLKEGLEGLLLPKTVKQKAGEPPKEIAKDPVEATNRNTDVTALNTVALESVAAALAGASSTTGGVVGSPEEKTKDELDKMAKDTGKAADDAKDNGEKFKESLGKVTAGIGIAAGSIMGIMAGMSQIKKGGTGNTLMGIGSILASVGGGIGGFMKLKGANGGTAAGGWKPFPVSAFANGGMVKGPTLGLVGEGKYNEAIVPLPDGRSIPVQMRGGPGGGGSSRDLLASQSQSRSSPSVLSMSFQSTTINGVEYVDRAQLEMAMAETRRVASRDGAARGANLAIDRLANSPSSRRRAGIR